MPNVRCFLRKIGTNFGERRKNHLKIGAYLIACYDNGNIIRKIFVLGGRKTHFFCLIRGKAQRIDKYPVVETFFFPRKNDRAFAFFKHAFFEKFKNQFFSRFSHFAFKIIKIEFCPEPLINHLKRFQTPLPPCFIEGHY